MNCHKARSASRTEQIQVTYKMSTVNLSFVVADTKSKGIVFKIDRAHCVGTRIDI